MLFDLLVRYEEQVIQYSVFVEHENAEKRLIWSYDYTIQ